MREPRQLTTVDFAKLTAHNIASTALAAGEATHTVLMTHRLVNCDSLYMRLTVRETSGNTSATAWNERGIYSVNRGGEFALNTVGKTTTSTTFRLDSDDAMREHGVSIVAPDSINPEDDPRTWTGAVYRQKVIEIGGEIYRIEAVAACSGVQGAFDRVVSGVIADVWISQRELQIRAQHALAA